MDIDTNGLVGALLRDLASIQTSKQSGLGYKRAAHMILGLERPIESFVQADGSLEKIANVGPKSERIILEVLRTGASPTVEQAVRESGDAADVAAARALRDNFLSRAQVLTVLADDALHGPSLAEYRGDVQMHSTWSDGVQSLDDIAAAAIARGYDFCAVTDHSFGLRIARGMSTADMIKQHAEIDAVNRRHEGRFRLIKGIEANIGPNGAIDMTAEELAQLEFVLVAPHSGLRETTDQTARMVAAVQVAGVHVLGHPRGRQYGTRAGVRADWDAVFAAAARAGVAIELDGDPARQDLDHVIARRALSAGCLFALDSDAHSVRELQYSETAVAHARLAGIPTERIINCWTAERFQEWLRSRRT